MTDYKDDAEEVREALLHTRLPRGPDIEMLNYADAEAARSRLVSHIEELERENERLRAAVPVLEYVSRGRGYIGVEPYPDALARRVLGALNPEEKPAT